MQGATDATTFVSKQVEASRLFFLDVKGAGDFAVVFGGYERCRPDYKINRRNFPWHCLEFVSRGTGTLHLANEDHELQPGSYYLYGPSLAHRIETSAGNPLGKYFVGFTGPGVESFFEDCGLAPGQVGRCMQGEPIRRAFDLLIDRGVRKSALARPLCSLITRQLLMMCQDDTANSVNTGSPAYGSYMRARDYIEANFLDLKSQEATAKACGMDAPYLCRLFSRYHDETPYQFLTRLRMDHAASLLLEGDASVKSVAAKLGYNDPFHFSRVFKSVHHVPPSRFRQSMHPHWPG